MKRLESVAPNPLLEAFEGEGHGWAGRLLEVLKDFESRLQVLESELSGPPPKSSGRVDPVFKRPSKK